MAPLPLTAGGPEPTVFRGTAYHPIHTPLSLALWLGAIHLNIALVLASLFLLSSLLALTVFGLMLVFMISPLDDASKLGRWLARYICEYTSGYFPMTLHVEELKAFNPNEAYGKCGCYFRVIVSMQFLASSHTLVLPMGVCALADLTGFMPLRNIKVLASSAVFYTIFKADMDVAWACAGDKEEFLPLSGVRL